MERTELTPHIQCPQGPTQAPAPAGMQSPLQVPQAPAYGESSGRPPTAISDLDLGVSEEAISIVRIPVLKEMRRELEEVIRRGGWDRQEGLVTVLAAGIAYLSAQAMQEHERERERERPQEGQRAQQPAPGYEAAVEAGPEEALDPVTRQLAYYHAMYSTMKFRAFTLLEKLKVLDMRVNGLLGRLQLDEKWATMARARMAGLEQENARLRQRLQELEGQHGGHAGRSEYER